MTGPLCPRCGGPDCTDDMARRAKAFTVPIERAGHSYTHWRMCRVLREPILIGGVRRMPDWLATFRAWWRATFSLAVQQAVVPMYQYIDLTTDTQNATGETTTVKFRWQPPEEVAFVSGRVKP